MPSNKQSLSHGGFAASVLLPAPDSYSSADYLRAFPFDKIKIDRSVTHGIVSRRNCAAVVDSALALAHGLDIATAAKGVEPLRIALSDLLSNLSLEIETPECESHAKAFKVRFFLRGQKLFVSRSF